MLLEGAEDGAAADHGQHREERRVAEALQGEDLAGELGEAQQPQQAEQPQRPQALQAGGEDRRGEDDDDQVERVVLQPGPAVGDDGEHHHQLGQEGEVGDPVEGDRDRVQRPARVRLRERHVGSTSAAAISIGVASRAATRVLRSSIPGP